MTQLDQVDAIVRGSTIVVKALGLSEAQLARRADLAPEAVPRPFSIDSPNPTALTLVALAEALDLSLVLTFAPPRSLAIR